MIKPFSNIAVVGGTRFDSNKGAALLNKSGVPATAINMSESPDEQLKLYSDPETVFHRFSEKCLNKGFSEFVFYCNSLSFSYPWNRRAELKIFELTGFYSEILSELKQESSLVVVAENATKSNIEEFVRTKNTDAKSPLRIDARLDLINALESATIEEQRQMIEELLTAYRKEGIRQVVLGCTHFDDPQLTSTPELKIYQPGLDLIDTVVQRYQAMK